jgi:hypothetical protein
MVRTPSCPERCSGVLSVTAIPFLACKVRVMI